MQGKIEAYIDSYDYLTILIDKSLKGNEKKFYLVDKNKTEELEILNCIEERDFYKYIVKFIPTIELHRDYIIKEECDNNTLLRSGAIIREKKFEDIYYYDGPLGVDYSKTRTIFRIWSPVAKEIYID